MRVLVVEDDGDLQVAIADYLRSGGFVVETTGSGEDAWFLGSTEDFEAIVLDLTLPDTDGLEVLTRWRGEGIETPVLILTARNQWLDRVNGINMGADDYLAKPFHMEELTARLHAVIRRSQGHAAPQIAAHGVTVVPSRMQVIEEGRPVELGPLEFRALAHLMQNLGTAVPAHELMDHVYGFNSNRSANALEALIKRLRGKLRTDLIKTRRGFGYLIERDEAGPAEANP